MQHGFLMGSGFRGLGFRGLEFRGLEFRGLGVWGLKFADMMGVCWVGGI